MQGMVTTSGHGELLGLVAGLHAIKLERPTGESHLLTDYLNGITAIERARAPNMKVAQWAYRPQSELYTWLGMLVKGQRVAPTKVRHVKAHTSGTDPDSILNDAADAAAKRAHGPLAPSHVTLPPPTGYMRAYVPYDHLQGYAPDAWQKILDERLADQQFEKLPAKHQGRLKHGRIGPNTLVRPYFYTKSPAKLVLKVQYLARAGHLESDYLLWKKGKRFTGGCSLCSYSVGNHRHLYRDCPATQPHRDKAIEEAVKRFRPHRLRNLSGDGLKAELDRLRPAFRQYLVDLIHNSSRPEYWCGLTGFPPDPLEDDDASHAHDCVIKLASHIYGRWLNGKNDGSKDPGSGSIVVLEDDDEPTGGGSYANDADVTDYLDNPELHPDMLRSTPRPIKSLPPKRQWVHYGGRRHTQLAEVGGDPSANSSSPPSRPVSRDVDSGVGPSRKRERAKQGDREESTKRGRMEERTGEDENGGGMEDTDQGHGTGKGKGKRTRGEKAADQDPTGDKSDGFTKRRRTQGSQPSLPDPSTYIDS